MILRVWWARVLCRIKVLAEGQDCYPEQYTDPTKFAETSQQNPRILVLQAIQKHGSQYCVVYKSGLEAPEIMLGRFGSGGPRPDAAHHISSSILASSVQVVRPGPGYTRVPRTPAKAAPTASRTDGFHKGC